MESHSSTAMTPHGPIRALHTEFFQRNKIRAHVKSDILQNFQIQKLHRSNRLFFRWCVSLSILYGVWFIALMKRHFMKNGIFLLLIFVWIFSGPLIRSQFRFFFLFSRCQLLLCMSKKETISSIAYIWIEFWHLNLNWLDRKWKTLIHAIIHNFCRFRLTRCSGLFFGP